jgi:hypothetical protein
MCALSTLVKEVLKSLGTNSAAQTATSIQQQLISLATFLPGTLFPPSRTVKKGNSFYDKPQEDRLSADVRLFHRRHASTTFAPGWAFS